MPELDIPAPGPESSRWIRSLRGPKNELDPTVAYGMGVEDEPGIDGHLQSMLHVLITNRECPWTCLMCDLWVNTTDDVVPAGAVAQQVDQAIARHPGTDGIKLYNAGSFFDRKAIPVSDHEAVARSVRHFRRVVVESHPALVGAECTKWQERLDGGLEVAMGLETIHPEVLPRLNKGMTAGDFAEASRFLDRNGIGSRAFILVRPPFLSDAEGVHWAIRSVEFAREAGVECVVLIPARAGNGAMDALAAAGDFNPPSFGAVEDAFDAAIDIGGGRAFVDLWDAPDLATCAECGPKRVQRLERMNRTQVREARVACSSCGGRV